MNESGEALDRIKYYMKGGRGQKEIANNLTGDQKFSRNRKVAKSFKTISFHLEVCMQICHQKSSSNPTKNRTLKFLGCSRVCLKLKKINHSVTPLSGTSLINTQ